MRYAIEASGLHKTFVKRRSIRELVTRPFSRPERVPALCGVDLAVREGEIFALLGPNGAGKTTLIGCVCGLVTPTGGRIEAFGLDMARDWRKARAKIGLVPQELSVDLFEKIHETRLWSLSQVIMPKYEGRMAIGSAFTGTLLTGDGLSTSEPGSPLQVGSDESAFAVRIGNLGGWTQVDKVFFTPGSGVVPQAQRG